MGIHYSQILGKGDRFAAFFFLELLSYLELNGEVSAILMLKALKNGLKQAHHSLVDNITAAPFPYGIADQKQQ